MLARLGGSRAVRSRTENLAGVGPEHRRALSGICR